LYCEYYITKTSSGYNAFFRDYYNDGDVYAASKYIVPFPYFYDRAKKEIVNSIYCMKYGIDKITEFEYYDSTTVDTVYEYIYSDYSYVKIDHDYDDKKEFFFINDYYSERDVKYYGIDDPDIYWDTRYFHTKDSNGLIVELSYYEDVSSYSIFNPEIFSTDDTAVIKYFNNSLIKLDKPEFFYEYSYYKDDYYYDSDDYYEDDYYYDDDYYTDDDYYL